MPERIFISSTLMFYSHYTILTLDKEIISYILLSCYSFATPTTAVFCAVPWAISSSALIATNEFPPCDRRYG